MRELKIDIKNKDYKLVLVNNNFYCNINNYFCRIFFRFKTLDDDFSSKPRWYDFE